MDLTKIVATDEWCREHCCVAGYKWFLTYIKTHPNCTVDDCIRQLARENITDWVNWTLALYMDVDQYRAYIDYGAYILGTKGAQELADSCHADYTKYPFATEYHHAMFDWCNDAEKFLMVNTGLALLDCKPILRENFAVGPKKATFTETEHKDRSTKMTASMVIETV